MCRDARWTPEAAPEGPVSVLLSAADQRVLVYRNGIEIGRARLQIRDPKAPIGTHAFVLLDPSQPTAKATGAEGRPRWVAVAVPGHEAEKGRALDPVEADRVTLPPDFLAKLRSVLAPGSTLLVTTPRCSRATTGVPLTIITGDHRPPRRLGRPGS